MGRTATGGEHQMWDLTELSDQALLQLWSEVMAALVKREVVASLNNPVGDLAERVVADYVQGQRARGNTKGHDVVGPDGTTYQVKGSRRKTDTSRARSIGVVRGLDGPKAFDYLMAVFFSPDLTPVEMWKVPHEVVLDPEHTSSLDWVGGRSVLVAAFDDERSEHIPFTDPPA